MRRRNYFIKKAFQANFSLRFAALLLIEALLIVGLFLYISRGALTTGYQGPELVIEKTSTFFLGSLILISLIVGIAVGLVGMLVFIFLSHRLAGPLYRFEKSLEEISRGNLTYRFRLRRTDQLEDLAQALNQFIAQMDEKIGRLKADLQEAVRPASGPEGSKTHSTLTETLEHAQGLADSFKTSS